MKLGSRIKQKLTGVNLTSVAFFAVSIISISLAWFAYTNTVNSDFSVNLKSWNIKITKNNVEVGNTFDININDLYPGMSDFSESYYIRNYGDIDAKIDYEISYLRVFNTEVVTSVNDHMTFFELERNYPFNIVVTPGKRFIQKTTTIGSYGGSSQLMVQCQWPMESGNDEWDTQYGNMAYNFYQQEEQLRTQDPSYERRSGIELKIRIKVSQFEDNSNSFATDSWDTIQLAIQSGAADSKYAVGNTKTVSIGNNNYTVRIVNKSIPNECYQSGRSITACGWIFEFADIITTSAMNSSGTNVGGYPATIVYDYLRNDLYDALPYELKKVIARTKVISGYGNNGTDSSNFQTYDKLYLLSATEIYGTDLGGNNFYDTSYNVTRQLDYYYDNNSSNKVTFNTGTYEGANLYKVIKQYNGSNYWWWLRSANSSYSYSFANVYNDGYLGGRYAAIRTTGVSPAFRIA